VNLWLLATFPRSFFYPRNSLRQPTEDEDDDEGRGRFGSAGALKQVSACIWTRDISKALRLAKALNAGAVWVNCSDVFDPNLPWGGFKQSGWGRELGQEGVEAFTELKAVTIKL
jgi:phenylacetaldehyde dehydrogenase